MEVWELCPAGNVADATTLESNVSLNQKAHIFFEQKSQIWAYAVEDNTDMYTGIKWIELSMMFFSILYFDIVTEKFQKYYKEFTQIFQMLTHLPVYIYVHTGWSKSGFA